MKDTYDRIERKVTLSVNHAWGYLCIFDFARFCPSSPRMVSCDWKVPQNDISDRFPTNGRIYVSSFFSIWILFHEHSRFTGQQGKGEAIS